MFHIKYRPIPLISPMLFTGYSRLEEIRLHLNSTEFQNVSLYS